MSQSDSFLQSFSRIEKHLRSVAGASHETSFYELVRKASGKSRPVARFSVDLKEFADLRNAIVHERTDAHVIAEPNKSAVAGLHRIEALLLSPPSVFPAFSATVTTLGNDDPIAAAVEIMLKCDFSQIPVITDGAASSLLTSETVARWLGASVEDDVFSLQETSIRQVLEFAEDPDNFVISRRDASLFDALDAFDRFSSEGRRLDALLISQNGTPTEHLLGILTVSDIPKVLKKLGSEQSRR